jgi:DNA-binding Lrp family transcriptional regulator
LDGAFFFSLSSQRTAARKALLKSLCERRDVAWVSILSGEYQYGTVFYAASMAEFNAALDEIGNACGGDLAEKTLAFRTAYWQFPRKYLSAESAVGPTLSMQSASQVVELSTAEKETLRTLIQQPGASLREHAAALQIALSTLQYRLKVLSAKGAICGWFYNIPEALLEIQSYKLLVFLNRVSSRAVNKLVSYAQVHPNFVYCMRTLGSWDFEAGIECERRTQVSEIVAQMYEQFGPAIRAVKVLGEEQELKYSLFPW